MSLVREATRIYPGPVVGDLKIAHYAISYTAGAIVKPTNDPNWILLNGCSLSTTTYAALFAIYGYAYGGSGANFNLPDLTEGRVPFAQGLTHYVTMGASGGEINHTLVTGEIASHTHADTLSFAASPHGHTVSATLGQADSHDHAWTNSALTGDVSGPIGNAPFTFAVTTTATPATSGAGGTHSHTGTFTLNTATSSITKSGSIGNTGSGSAHNNMQPYVATGGWLVKFQ